MPLKAPPTPLVISLTQGSADAFVQGSVLSGLSARQAYALRGVALEFPNGAALSASLGTADMEIQVALTRRSKTAIPNISDSDVIAKFGWVFGVLTSGVVMFPSSIYWKPDLEMPLVEETLYAQLDSTATGLSNLAVVRMDVDLDTISDIDRLNLITRSLT